MRSLVIAALLASTAALAASPASYTIYCQEGDPSLPSGSAGLPQCTITSSTTSSPSDVPAAAVNAGSIAYSNDLATDGWEKVRLTMNTTGLLSSSSSSSVSSSTSSSSSTDAPAPLGLGIASRYYAMGFLEGYVTFPSVYSYYNALLTTALGSGGGDSAAEAVSSGNGNFITMGQMVADPKVQQWVATVMQNVAAYANTTVASSSAPSRKTRRNEKKKKSGADAPLSAPIAGYTSRLQNLLSQLNGMADGYKSGCEAIISSSASSPLPRPSAYYACDAAMLAAVDRTAIVYLNMRNELLDVYNAVSDGSGNRNATYPDGSPSFDNYLNTRGASVLVSVTPTDIIVGHSAVDAYAIGLRKQYKTYSFEDYASTSSSTSSSAAAAFVTMSSYPGAISSLDEFYMSGAGLTVAATQLVSNNNTMMAEALLLGDDDTTAAVRVPSFLRAMLANLYATSTAAWADVYTFLRSGAYASQWTVVDMKRFVPASPDASSSSAADADVYTSMPTVPQGTVAILETMGAAFTNTDASASLIGTTSGPNDCSSINGGCAANQTVGYTVGVPYIARSDAIYALSGAAQLAAYYGDGYFSAPYVFSPSTNPMVLAVSLTVPTLGGSLAGVVDTMRANLLGSADGDYSTIANCSTVANSSAVCNPVFSATLAAGARADLNPSTSSADVNYGPLAKLYGPRAFGALDVKVTSFASMGGASAADVVVDASLATDAGAAAAAFTALLVAGPSSNAVSPLTTAAGLTVFDWSSNTIPHAGLADRFAFAVVNITTDVPVDPFVPPAPVDPDVDEEKNIKMISVGIAGGVGVLLFIIGLAYYVHRKKKMADHEHLLNVLALIAEGGGDGDSAAAARASYAQRRKSSNLAGRKRRSLLGGNRSGRNESGLDERNDIGVTAAGYGTVGGVADYDESSAGEHDVLIRK